MTNTPDPTPEPGAEPAPVQKKKRVKWEPPSLMVGVLIFGVWLVLSLGTHPGLPPARPGAVLTEMQIGPVRGALEMYDDGTGVTYRLLYRDGTASEILGRRQMAEIIPPERLAQIEAVSLRQSPMARAFFRVFNITGWYSLVWVAIGLGGQVAFFGRMAVQWVLSEKKRQSVVPASFWWLSLIGGVCLFTYFVWRQDVVGVLGQSTGVVIYGRNLRLIHKQKKREARHAAEALRRAQMPPCDPNPERGVG